VEYLIAMFARNVFLTMRCRDRVLIRLAIISLFFAGCYLSQYSPPRVVLWRNPDPELLDPLPFFNVTAVSAWSKCRRTIIPIIPQKNKDVNQKIQEVKIY
jgi:hypothetical protein